MLESQGLSYKSVMQLVSPTGPNFKHLRTPTTSFSTPNSRLLCDDNSRDTPRDSLQVQTDLSVNGYLCSTPVQSSDDPQLAPFDAMPSKSVPLAQQPATSHTSERPSSFLISESALQNYSQQASSLMHQQTQVNVCGFPLPCEKISQYGLFLLTLLSSPRARVSFQVCKQHLKPPSLMFQICILLFLLC